MDDAAGPPPDQPDQEERFADRLNYLFATRPSSRGRPYTLREVSEATGGKLSQAYISAVRKGVIAVPSGEKVHLLAEFFGVEPGYFYGRTPRTEEPEPLLTEALRRALTLPGVLQGMLHLADLEPEERGMILAMIERAHALATRLKAPEQPPGAGSSGGPGAPSTQTARSGAKHPRRPRGHRPGSGRP